MCARSDLPRAPAHAGMLPRDPFFGAATDDCRHALEAILPDVVGVERMILDPEAADTGRFYRVRRRDGEVWFLKVLPEDDYAGIAAADALAARLPRCCGAVRSSGVLRFADGSNRVAVAYPFIASRYATAEPADLAALGRAIAGLHQGLREIQDRLAIAERARARTRRLLATLQRASNAQGALEDVDVEWDDSRLASVLDGDRAQPLHGDLNPGNILFELESGAIRFLDFEDARHSFGPPLLDLALPLERLCLLDDDEATAVESAIQFLRAYAEAGSVAPIATSGALATALRFINLRALALMIERRNAGLETSPQEWRKFTRLLRHHDARHDAIAQIERALLS